MTPSRPKVLAVDDEDAILRALTLALEARGYEVVDAATGQEAIDLSTGARATFATPAAVILDLGLPDIEGVEVVRRLRRGCGPNLPIIVLTALGADDQRLAALDAGAHDYLAKPYSMPELLAHLQLALDHRASADAADDMEPVDRYAVGDLVVDTKREHVELAGELIPLSHEEFAFIAFLARQPARVLTHRAILEEVWGPGHDRDTRYLRGHARQIRVKLHDDPTHARLITEPGVGYRLVDPDRVHDPATRGSSWLRVRMRP